MLVWNTFSIISFFACLTSSSVYPSDCFGSSAHLVGFGGGSSFFLAYCFLGCFFFFFLGSSPSGLGISFPYSSLGSLCGNGSICSTIGLAGIYGRIMSSSVSI
jgi:hypothetical protein